MSMSHKIIVLKDKKEEKKFIIVEMTATTVLMDFLPLLFKSIGKKELINALNLVLQTTDIEDNTQIETNINPINLILNSILEILANANQTNLKELYNLILSHVKVIDSSNQTISITTNIDIYVKSPVTLGKLIYEVLLFNFSGVYNDFLDLKSVNLKEK